ncbi:MAG: tetratricopeptide repeat protein, partial [Chloroflexota bacterium]|nr:tetratricopeptide repeat protein [Chloroflexota bacterium]
WAAEGGETELGLRLARRLVRFWHVRGHVSEGRAWFERLLAAASAAPPDVRAWPTYNAGFFAWAQGDLTRAETMHQESLALYREMGDTAGVARVLGNVGELALLRDDLDRAEACSRESLLLHWEVGYKEGVAYALKHLAGVAAAQGDPERAARLFGAAAALREAIGTPLPPSERAGHERTLVEARRCLGDDAFAAAWATGRSLPLEEARAEALASPERAERT